MSIQQSRPTKRIGPRLYVAPSPTGNDSTGDGSSTNPYATIVKASTVASAGTTVFVAPGTYGSVYMTEASGGGSAGAPVTYISTVKWGAKIVATGTDYAWYLGDQGTKHPDHIRIIGFEMTAPNSNNGIIVDASDVWIQNCHIYNICNNTDNTGGGINLEGFYNGVYGATGNAAIGNWVHHIGRSTNTFAHPIYVGSPNCYVANNVVFDTGGWGIHCYHGPNGSQVINNTVFNCTFSGGILWGDGPEVLTHSGYTANNIVRNCNIGIGEAGVGIDGTVYRNNALFSNSQNTSLYTSDISGTITSDPLMVNYQPDGSGDYHLSGSSTLIGSGLAANAPSTDYDGLGRSQPPSIGAFN